MDISSESPHKSTWLDRPLTALLPKLNVENALIALILLLAVITRFYHVDLRVMAHDEVNHVVPAYDLYRGRGYFHDPVTHGPMQFHLLAASYFLLGDNDFSARVPAVLFSIATVAVVALGYRRYLGRTGGLIAAGLFLISPYMLFYGRYVRNEAFVALFGVVMLLSVLRYLEQGKTASLYWLTAALVGQFITKETSYIYTAQLLLFLAVIFVNDVTHFTWKSRTQHTAFLLSMLAMLVMLAAALGLAVVDARATGVGVGEAPGPAVAAAASSYHIWVLIAVGLALAAGVLAMVLLILGTGWAHLKEVRSFNLLMLVGTLILPQLTAFPVKLAGFNPLDYMLPGLYITLAFLIGIFILSAVLGLLWNWRVWLISAGMFYGVFTLFYTTFFTNGRGFATGIIGSLGYWLSQQGVNRGEQPWYYYGLLQIPMYEYLAAIGTLLALYFGIKYWRFATLPGFAPAHQPEPIQPQTTEAVIEGDDAQNNPDKALAERQAAADEPLRTPAADAPVKVPTLGLLLFWSLTSLIAYSIAGEKMPWLTVHIALPMLLAAGWGFGFLADTTPWKRIINGRGLLTLVLLPVFLIAAGRVLGGLLGTERPFQGATLEQLQATNLFLLAAALTLGSGYVLLRLLAGWSGREITRLFAAALAVVLAFLTARAAFTASYINYDNAKEYLVYAHAARGPKDILEQVEEISTRITGGKDIAVAYDNDSLYPFWWYFRDYPFKNYYAEKPTRDLRDSPIVIVGNKNFSKLEPIMRDNFYMYEYMRLWWPMQDYYNLTWERIRDALTNPAMRSALFKIWLNRDYTEYAAVTGNQNLTLTTWAPSEKIRMYVRKDIVAQMWNFGAQPVAAPVVEDPYIKGTIQLAPEMVVGMEGSGVGQFNNAHGVAVAADGSLYVADSGNHRIQHIGADGQVLEVWGTFADVAQGDAPGGTFNEPWGVAVGPDGSVYVTDTWNHRIQKFSPSGAFITMWGHGGQADTPDAFWGPRGITVDEKGRVFVTDTGNQRVVVFDANGNPITQFGSLGMEAGMMDEPVGIALDAEGRVYVADTWNQRVQVFAPDADGLTYTSVLSFDINGWIGKSTQNKPFLTVGPDGNLYVGDPEGYRVLVFDRQGKFLRAWGQYSTETDGFGLVSGIAVDGSGRVWVSDPANFRLMRFVVPQITVP